MKVITICQPYAHLIAVGVKRVENRSWYTDHRGWLAIHAGKSGKYLAEGDRERYPEMAFGALVAVAWLGACVRIEGIPTLIDNSPELGWLEGHEHAEGPYCWVLERVYPLGEPLPFTGQQGLYSVGEDVVERMRATVLAAGARLYG